MENHHAIKFGKPSISIRAINTYQYHGELLVITRWYHAVHQPTSTPHPPTERLADATAWYVTAVLRRACRCTWLKSSSASCHWLPRSQALMHALHVILGLSKAVFSTEFLVVLMVRIYDICVYMYMCTIYIYIYLYVRILCIYIYINYIYIYIYIHIYIYIYIYPYPQLMEINSPLDHRVF